MTELQQRRQLAGSTAWLLSEAKTGLEVQTQAVADRLGLAAERKTLNPRGIWKAAAAIGILDPSEKIGEPGSQFAPPWPSVAIGAGVASLPYLKALKRKAGANIFTIALQKAPPSLADLVCVPEHDRPAGSVNVLTLLTAPHGFSQARLADLRSAEPANIAPLPHPRVAILVGGPNAVFRYTETDRQRLAWAISSLASFAGSFLVTTSRRTTRDMAAAIDEATASRPRLFYTGDGNNPYASILAHADAFLVTADSVNMTGEALSTGRPVYVFEPSGGSAKFRRFHEALMAAGYTRKCPPHFDVLDQWSYTPLDPAATIAAEVERRWTRRSRMLSGLMNKPA